MIDIKRFKEDLDKDLQYNNGVDFSGFQNNFIATLHKHVPIKNKILRFNNTAFMSKALKEKQLCIDQN